MIRGAIFDVDGVLLDSLGIWDTLGDRYLRQRGITPAPTLRSELETLSMEEGAEWLKKRYALTERTPDILAGLNAVLADFYLHQAGAREQIVQIAQRLHQRGMKLAVATSGSLSLAQAALKRLSLHPLFAHFVSCAQAGAGKQQPDVYQLCAQKLGMREEQLLVFEDAPFALRCALDAGFHGIGVSEPHHDQRLLHQISEIYIDEQMSAETFIQKLREKRLI